MAQRATTTFHLPGPVTVNSGEVRADDDPIVVKYPQFFVDASELTVRAVETATTRPGVKRGKRDDGHDG